MVRGFKALLHGALQDHDLTGEIALRNHQWIALSPQVSLHRPPLRRLTTQTVQQRPEGLPLAAPPTYAQPRTPKSQSSG
jgi:hypothetical protein